jgi:hypothetical protein
LQVNIRISTSFAASLSVDHEWTSVDDQSCCRQPFGTAVRMAACLPFYNHSPPPERRVKTPPKAEIARNEGRRRMSGDSGFSLKGIDIPQAGFARKG